MGSHPSKARLSTRDFARVLAVMGLPRDDHRFRGSMAALEERVTQSQSPEQEEAVHRSSRQDFCLAVRYNILLIERALPYDVWSKRR